MIAHIFLFLALKMGHLNFPFFISRERSFHTIKHRKSLSMIFGALIKASLKLLTLVFHKFLRLFGDIVVTLFVNCKADEGYKYAQCFGNYYGEPYPVDTED